MEARWIRYNIIFHRINNYKLLYINNRIPMNFYSYELIGDCLIYDADLRLVNIENNVYIQSSDLGYIIRISRIIDNIMDMEYTDLRVFSSREKNQQILNINHSDDDILTYINWYDKLGVSIVTIDIEDKKSYKYKFIIETRC